MSNSLNIKYYDSIKQNKFLDALKTKYYHNNNPLYVKILKIIIPCLNFMH